MKLLEVVTGLNVLLKVLQERFVVVLALVLTAGLYGWAMWLQTVLGAIIAAAWGLTIFLPVLYTGSRGASDVQEAAQHPGTPE